MFGDPTQETPGIQSSTHHTHSLPHRFAGGQSQCANGDCRRSTDGHEFGDPAVGDPRPLARALKKGSSRVAALAGPVSLVALARLDGAPFLVVASRCRPFGTG